MKLSTRSRYGLRLMCDLALHYGEGVMLLKDIAAHTGISGKYLSNLAIPLKGAGLINSTRGFHGGYELAREPGKITVKEIYYLLEGDPVILDCIGNKNLCKQTHLCPTQKMWSLLQKNIFTFLENITLKNLVEDYQERRSL
ncbi:MAG: Rrf2 family transcriptional regulator [Spirochaetales bacterium]|nr:Rrf2 family transcriptional regulator [Spirochaetales bacterium]